MKKSTKAYVEMIIETNKKEITKAIKQNDLIIGIRENTCTYSTIISLPSKGSMFNRDREVFAIQTYETGRSAKKLAREIKMMFVERFGEF